MSTVDDDIQTIASQSATLRDELTERFGRQTHYSREQLDAVFAAGVVPATFHAYGIAMFAEPSERPGLLQRIHSSKTAHELRKWLIGDVFFYYLPSGSGSDDMDFHEVLDSPSSTTTESSDECASDFDAGDDGE